MSSLPRQHSGFDEHRNTSRVWPVPPTALPDVRRALAAFERDYPELHRWIVEGHPRLTEAEHVIRFGRRHRYGLRTPGTVGAKSRTCRAKIATAPVGVRFDFAVVTPRTSLPH